MSGRSSTRKSCSGGCAHGQKVNKGVNKGVLPLDHRSAQRGRRAEPLRGRTLDVHLPHVLAVSSLFLDSLNDMGALVQHFAWEVHAHELYLRDRVANSSDAVFIMRVSTTRMRGPCAAALLGCAVTSCSTLAKASVKWRAQAPEEAPSPGTSVRVCSQSVTKEHDPLMDFMRKEGLLMAPRWCGNGSLVASEVAAVDIDPWGPLWACDLEGEVVRALVNATASAPTQHARKVRGQLCALGLQFVAWQAPTSTPHTRACHLHGRLRAQLPVPCVAFFLPFVALPDAVLPGTGQLNLTAPLLLVGSLAPTNVTSALDLTARTTALMEASDAGRLYASQLVRIVLFCARPTVARQSNSCVL